MSGVERSTGPLADDPFAMPGVIPDVLDAEAADLPVGVDGDGDAVPLDIEKVRLYQRLRDAQDAADTEGKALKEEADKLQEELIAMFSENGLQNLNVDGRTVYLHRSIYAQRRPGVTADDVQKALIACGEADLVKPTVNGNTLNAWVRELTEADDAEGLPPEMDGILEPGERFSMRVIAGGTKAKSKTHSK